MAQLSGQQGYTMQRPFKIASVIRAARITRDMLNSWQSRGLLEPLLEVSADPGQGRARRYSFEEIVSVAVIAELVRFGLRVTAASAAVISMQKHAVFHGDESYILVIAAPAKDDGLDVYPAEIFKADEPLYNIRAHMKYDALTEPTTLAIVDVSAVVRRVKQALSEPVTSLE